MTTLLLVFAAVLLLAVMLSNLAKRTILSTAVIFLVAGFLCGEGVTGLIPLEPGNPIVATASTRHATPTNPRTKDAAPAFIATVS